MPFSVRAPGLQFEEPGDQGGGLSADHDLTRFADGLQAGRHVGHLTPDVGEPLLSAGGDRRHQHLARMDAGPRLQVADPECRRELGSELHDVLDDLHAGGRASRLADSWASG